MRAEGGSATPGEPWVRIGAPAKINLHLEILARRSDGFHELESLFLALDLLDIVSARRVDRAGVHLSVLGPCASPDIPSDRRNLVVRAVEDALAETGDDLDGLGIELTLEKHVPSGAGLGGGSADAAAALVALDRVLGREPDRARRRTLLAALGSDCVFFESAFDTGFALAKGRGEEVSPRALRDRDWSVVLVVPNVHCNTARIYGALPKPLSGPPRAPSLALERFDGTQDEVRAELFNRLEEVALRIHPELVAWRSLFDDQDARHFRMSGSGSSFFGVFRDRAEADHTARRLEREASARGLELRKVCVTRPTGAGWLDLDSDRATAPGRRT